MEGGRNQWERDISVESLLLREEELSIGLKRRGSGRLVE